VTTLTTFPFNKWLDLPRYRGQRVERFRFEWRNGLTNETLGWLQPLKDSSPPTLSHDTSSSIKRRFSIALGVRDTAAINPITDRILPWLEIGDDVWPLGRYMFTDDTRVESTRGQRGTFVLMDEGFAIDQELTTNYASTQAVSSAVSGLVDQVNFITQQLEATEFAATGAFTAGSTRGQALDAYSQQGDYFPYWMDHTGLFRMIRTFDPGKEIPNLDYDENPRVRRGSIARSSDVLNAPNRFVVIGNGGESATAAISGVYDVPPSAPHSIVNRGFIQQKTEQLQVTSSNQAAAVARNMGIRQTIYERISFETPIDPRHDSYNVVRLQDANWLELSWSITMMQGAPMQHLVRKAYE
jgi:hypothetical protein